MSILNPNDEEEIYEIKAIFPFSSETKRMGIIVKNVEGKAIIKSDGK
jgi:magnesium-transporting ATPase (P-type)